MQLDYLYGKRNLAGARPDANSRKQHVLNADTVAFPSK
jgi:hypothetical protein